ncbi:MAG: vWA domain-containing protein [Clostridia bacterium]
MYGKGNNQLTEAMDYILNEEEASKNLLQFSSKDKITIIPFNHDILGEYTTEDGRNTKDLINKISTSVSGGTDIYLPAMKGLEILSQEDLETYNVSIVLMTDGASNYNRLDELTRLYKQTGKDIPILA